MFSVDGKRENFPPAGNRTPVSRVTGGDTHHYTTEDLTVNWKCLKKKSTVLYQAPDSGFYNNTLFLVR